jgi:hypothetical protein
LIFKIFKRQTSDPKSVEIYVSFKMISNISFPRVS